MRKTGAIGSLVLVVLAWMSACVSSPSALAKGYAPDFGTLYGTIVNIDHANGGIIRAENFNSSGGAMYSGFYGYTPGNQGTYTGRADNASIDIDLYNPTNGATGVYIKSWRSDAAHVMSNANREPEWANYRFNVTESGWYKIQWNGMAEGVGDSIQTAIDDYAYAPSNFYLGGSYRLSISGSFSLTDGPQFVRLTAGNHNIRVALSPWLDTSGLYGACLEYIKFTPISAPNIPAPRIVTTVFPSGGVVVADAVVTDKQFGAAGDGKTDDTAAIQRALDLVGNIGGGTVFLPARVYRIKGTLSLPNSVTLRGDWAPPTGTGNGAGTILKATYDGPGVEVSTPFISTQFNGTVKYLSVWYPNQTDLTKPIPYGWTITGAWPLCISNITLYNTYDGIFQAALGFNSDWHDIYMTALNRGILREAGNDYEFVNNVWIQNHIWKNAASPIVRPVSNNALDDYTNAHLVGWQQGRGDSNEFYNINVQEPSGIRNANIGFLTKLTDFDVATACQNGWYGAAAKLNADIQEVGYTPAPPYVANHNGQTLWFGTLHFQNVDLITQTSKTSYTFGAFRSPAKTGPSDLFNVRFYGALGDGVHDDTAAIHKALLSAKKNGGGVVYLPAGQYFVSSPLVVPKGVELRGPMDAAMQCAQVDCCVLLACQNEGLPGAAPFITLSENSGVRGFKIAYPTQGYASSANPTCRQVQPYPPAIRGNGSGVWVVNVCAVNVYDFIDFATNRCDDHLVSDTWGTPIKYGISVGGGSRNGKVEKSVYHHWQLATSSPLKSYAPYSGVKGGSTAVCSTLARSLTAYRFGTCDNETGFALNSFTPLVGMLFQDDGGSGPRSPTFWLCGFDVYGVDAVTGSCVRVEKGSNINLIGGQYCVLETTAPWLRTTSTFSGAINIYGRRIYLDGAYPSVNGGKLFINDERSLTYGQPAWANSTRLANNHGAAESALDAREQTMWHTVINDGTSGEYWLRVDLGQPSDIMRWALVNAGPAYGTNYNTGIADLQYSNDGVSWTTLDTLDSPNSPYGGVDYYDMNLQGQSLQGHISAGPPGSATSARYVRVKVRQGTQNGYDGFVRIPEFLVYGLNNQYGWQFGDGTTEGWHEISNCTLSIDSSGPYGYTKRLAVKPSGSRSQIMSGDNLNIDTSRYRGIRVKMMNETSSKSASMQYITEVDGKWTVSKSASCIITANDHSYRTYDFTDWGSWKGTIRQLSFFPTGSADGSVKLASISFIPISSPSVKIAK